MRLIMADHFRKAAGEGCDAACIDHVTLETLQMLDEDDAVGDMIACHRKGGGSEAIRFINVGTDDRETNDAVNRLGTGFRIVDMLSPNIRPGGGDAAVADGDHFDDFVDVEGVTNADAPILTLIIFADDLNITARFDVEVLITQTAQEFGGIVDCPALDDARRINGAVVTNVKVTVGLL